MNKYLHINSRMTSMGCIENIDQKVGQYVKLGDQDSQNNQNSQNNQDRTKVDSKDNTDNNQKKSKSSDTLYSSISSVKLYPKIAIKRMPLEETYWLREYYIIKILQKIKSNIPIIRFDSIEFMNDPHTRDVYVSMTMPRYQQTLTKYNSKITTDKQLLQILYDVVFAIYVLHLNGIWHRDIKPDNILIDKQRAILIDFSHSIYCPYLGNISALDPDVITYCYRPPEVFNYQNKPDKSNLYTHLVDMWSMGILLFELVCKKYLWCMIDQDHVEAVKLKNPKEECIKITPELSENLMSQFVSKDEHVYLEYIHSKYLLYAKSFSLKEHYWEWISQLLSREPCYRLSAGLLLDKIISVAHSNNIAIHQFSIPSIISYSLHEKYRIYNVNIEQWSMNKKCLMSICWDLIKKILDMYDANINNTYLKRVFRYLINIDTITLKNHVAMSIAIFTTLSCILNDEIYYISKITEKLYAKWHMHIDDKDICLRVAHFVDKHEKDIVDGCVFGYYDREHNKDISDGDNDSNRDSDNSSGSSIDSSVDSIESNIDSD